MDRSSLIDTQKLVPEDQLENVDIFEWQKALKTVLQDNGVYE